MMKRFKYSLPISAVAAAAAIGSFALNLPLLFSVATLFIGFLAGFAVGVEKVYKAATGEKVLSDDGLTEVLERIL